MTLAVRVTVTPSHLPAVTVRVQVKLPATARPPGRPAARARAVLASAYNNNTIALLNSSTKADNLRRHTYRDASPGRPPDPGRRASHRRWRPGPGGIIPFTVTVPCQRVRLRVTSAVAGGNLRKKFVPHWHCQADTAAMIMMSVRVTAHHDSDRDGDTGRLSGPGPPARP